MGFAPLAFLRGREPPRTKTSHQNPCKLEDGASMIEFYTPISPGAYFSKQVIPVNNVRANGEPSFFKPPAHYHLLQDEHFTVDSGAGIWYFWGGKNVRLQKGDSLKVPARKWHYFESAPDSGEPLVILYRYRKEYPEMEERFFRNVFCYFDDCRKVGLELSLFQLLVFCRHCWMPVGLPIPGPEWFNLLINTILMFVGGFIGEFLLGYRASYPEYYAEKPKEA